MNKSLEYIDAYGNVQYLKSTCNVYDYQKIEKLGEGAYGVVYKAKTRSNGKIVVLKLIKNFSSYSNNKIEPIINLMIAPTPESPIPPDVNIVYVRDMCWDESDDKITLVFDYIDTNLSSVEQLPF